jgi:hypothetical protein
LEVPLCPAAPLERQVPLQIECGTLTGMANHTAITLYSIAFALEVGAAYCAVKEILRARDRTSKVRSLAAVDFPEYQEKMAEFIALQAEAADASTGIEPELVLDPELLSLRLLSLQRGLHSTALVVEGIRMRSDYKVNLIEYTTDALGTRWTAVVGATLLALSLVVGFLGNVSSAGAFGH